MTEEGRQKPFYDATASTPWSLVMALNYMNGHFNGFIRIPRTARGDTLRILLGLW